MESEIQNCENTNIVYFETIKNWLDECLAFFTKNSIDKVVLDSNSISIIDVIDQLKYQFDQQNLNFGLIIKTVDQFKALISYYYGQTDLTTSPIFSGMLTLINLIPKYVLLNQKIQSDLVKVLESKSEIEGNIDLKTGYLTESGFRSVLERNFVSMKESGKGTLAVIYFDGNNLKDINDKFGHDFGQKYIYKMGDIIAKSLEGLGKDFQLSNIKGGDERVALIVDSNKKELKRFIRKLFNSLKSERYTINSESMQISMCAGISYIKAEKILKEDELIKEDKKIKKEKINGFVSKDLLDFADVCMIESKHYKEHKRVKYPYQIIDLRKVENIHKYRINRKRLPIKRRKSKLKEKNMQQLIQLRNKYSRDLTKARIVEAKEILNKNIDLINIVVSEKLLEESTNHFVDLQLNIIKSVDDLTKKILKDVQDTELIIEIVNRIKDAIKLNFNKKVIDFNSVLDSVK